ncbi:MAG: hypothetical protein QOJ64_1293 [Acidobacteriota bacterium]|nr:hypothetical protein [Acidobacteriota bacterium]
MYIEIVNKKSFALLLMIAVALIGASASAIAQPKTTSQPAKAAEPASVATLRLLPRSDVVAFVNVARLLNEAVPKALADSPAKLAEFNADLDKFKSQTGIDARSFEDMAIGMLYQHPRPEITTTDIVFIARGSFNSNVLLAAARLASQGKYREEKYGSSTIYIFTVRDQVKMLGLLKMRVGEVAATALDSGTLVLGELSSVRATLDANKTPGRVNAELIQSATRTPAAVMGFGANVPMAVTSTADFGNPEIGKIIGSIRHAYGAISTTDSGFEMLSVARTEKPEQAQALSETIGTLKQFGAMIVSQLPPATGKLAQTALDNLKVSSTGNEMSLRLEIAQADISALMRFLQPKIADAR